MDLLPDGVEIGVPTAAVPAVGLDDQTARAALSGMLLRAARAQARRRWPGLPADDREHMAAAVAQSAQAAITGGLDSYRGDSDFGTWALKFVIVALTDAAGRRYWQSRAGPDGPPDWDVVARELAGSPGAPGARVLAAALRRAAVEDLTASERAIFAASSAADLPSEAFTAGLGPGRSAIYQALYQARRKISARLAADAGDPAMDPAAANAARERPGGLLAAEPGDTGCEIAFQTLDRYAGARRQNQPAQRKFPSVAAHLRSCRPCGQDYQDLLAATASTVS